MRLRSLRKSGKKIPEVEKKMRLKKSEKKNEEMRAALYPVLAGVAVLSLLFVVFSLFNAGSVGTSSGSNVVAGNSASLVAPSDCGDLKSSVNIQHLSHHPDRYQACLKLIDPSDFKSATGQDLSAFLR